MVSNTVFLIALLGIQLGFTVLDLGERLWNGRRRYPDERLRVGTVLFLVATIVVFLAIQAGLTFLLPKATSTLDAVQAWFVDWIGRPAPTAGEAIGAGPLALLCIVSFYVSGLFDYLAHRFFSHSRPFWWTHEYHHLPREVFVALPGLSVRPFAVFTTVAVTFATITFAYGFLAVLGWPLWDLRPMKLFVLVNALILTTSHSSFLRQWWWPHYLLRAFLLTTPHEHLIHHSIDRPGNYGNVTTLWDRLLGTYVDPALPENQGLRLGLAYDQDFLGTLTFGAVKLPASWRRRFQLARYCNLEPAPAPADGAGEAIGSADAPQQDGAVATPRGDGAPVG